MSKGQKIVEPLLDGELVQLMRDDFDAYLTQTYIQPEQGEGMCPLSPTSAQLPVLEALDASPISAAGDWFIINKPRQAQTSTLCAAWLLREIEFGLGKNGLLICDKDATNAELFERIRLMHTKQPDEIRVPAQRNAAKELSFPAGGRLKVATARGKNPAIGFSIDRLVCSEFGFWPAAQKVAGQLFPTMLKRPEARAIIESTPSLHGHYYQRLWYSALEGHSRLKPIFIRWYEHAAYLKPPPEGWAPDLAMLRIMERHPGMQVGHAWFMVEALDSIFNGDMSLFLHSYPMGPRDGWLTTEMPALPKDPLLLLEAAGLPDHPVIGRGFTPADKPRQNHQYLVVADPAGYGNVGDPSALTVIDLTERREVAAWSGRMDPSVFGVKCVEVAQHWSRAVLVIESNAAAAITAALYEGYPRLYSKQGTTQPGYYTTAQNKEAGSEALASALHSRQLEVRSRAGIAQMLAYDGTEKRATIEGERVHWDRVVTYRIACAIMRDMKLPEITPPPAATITVLPQTAADILKLRALQRKKRRP
tara:strand:+ start:1170 stop:2768 length:1599 start_codon:yes stop_codon:yes gene_type:complete